MKKKDYKKDKIKDNGVVLFQSRCVFKTKKVRVQWMDECLRSPSILQTPPSCTHTYIGVWGTGVGEYRGAGGSGKDEQRKWVSMDEWRGSERKKDRGGEERTNRKMPLWIITGGAFKTARTERTDVSETLQRS